MASWSDRLTDYVSGQWHVIRQAKGVFGVVAFLLVAATAFTTWRVAESFYSERIATKDALIKYLESQAGPRETTGGNAKNSESRLEITYQYIAPTTEQHFVVNVFVSNKGEIPVNKLLHTHSGALMTKLATRSDLDGIFGLLHDYTKKVRSESSASSNQIFPGQPALFWSIEDFGKVGESVASHVSQDEWNKVISGPELPICFCSSNIR